MKEITEHQVCPYCAETIMKGASMCKHCKSQLSSIIEGEKLTEGNTNVKKEKPLIEKKEESLESDEKKDISNQLISDNKVDHEIEDEIIQLYLARPDLNVSEIANRIKIQKSLAEEVIRKYESKMIFSKGVTTDNSNQYIGWLEFIAGAIALIGVLGGVIIGASIEEIGVYIGIGIFIQSIVVAVFLVVFSGIARDIEIIRSFMIKSGRKRNKMS